MTLNFPEPQRSASHAGPGECLLNDWTAPLLPSSVTVSSIDIHFKDCHPFAVGNWKYSCLRRFPMGEVNYYTANNHLKDMSFGENLFSTNVH